VAKITRDQCGLIGQRNTGDQKISATNCTIRSMRPQAVELRRSGEIKRHD
jgi:hypothetical protein